MGKIILSLNHLYTSYDPIVIGLWGENEPIQIYLDFSDYVTTYGDGSATLVHQLPNKAVGYPVANQEISGNYLIWTPSGYDLSKVGTGHAEFRYYTESGSTIKSHQIPTIIKASIKPDVNAASDDWIDSISKKSANISELLSAGVVRSTCYDSDTKILSVLYYGSEDAVEYTIEGKTESEIRALVESYGYITSSAISGFAKTSDLAALQNSVSENASAIAENADAIAERRTALQQDAINNDLEISLKEYADQHGSGAVVSDDGDGNLVIESGNGSSSSNQFWAVYNETAFDDVVSAYDAGKAVFCNYNSKQYQLAYLSSLIATFIAFSSSSTIVYLQFKSGGTWSAGSASLQRALTAGDNITIEGNVISADVPTDDHINELIDAKIAAMNT